MARCCNRIHLVWHLYYTGTMLVRPSASPTEGDWVRRLRASGLLLLLRIRNVFTLLWGDGRPVIDESCMSAATTVGWIQLWDSPMAD